MKKFRVALIGVGGRGEGLYRVALKFRDDAEYVAVCDSYIDRCEYIADEMVEDGRPRPKMYTDYIECIDNEELDAIVVATAWEAHLKVTMYAMEKGIAVACEVGGSYSLEALWELVRCYERTKTPIMMIENCCYGQIELLALNMKRLGLLGKIAHCEGGYRHDLREEVTTGAEKRHYRLEQYIHRNCENYPTHEIGPIAKILDINCGNRFVSLVSVGNTPIGLEDYVDRKNIESLKGVKFLQSDVITTVLKCQNGETVTITLDTCLPRYYSRGFLVQGTEGLVCEENQSVYLEKEFTEECWSWKDNFNNIQKYYDQYNHNIWKDYHPGEEGHGGMDWLVFEAFFKALKENKPMPIDVYDMATWMAISVLSEQSLVTGQAVAFPDFTDGKWILRKNEFEID
ncbi:MAG: Gfo/Idh/MocA family oxidoreductase [Clostridia bacterium]|nr:Gfo/Idh/MocA family oxidoreductase [Clostridia bacterium]